MSASGDNAAGIVSSYTLPRCAGAMAAGGEEDYDAVPSGGRCALAWFPQHTVMCRVLAVVAPGVPLRDRARVSVSLLHSWSVRAVTAISKNCATVSSHAGQTCETLNLTRFYGSSRRPRLRRATWFTDASGPVITAGRSRPVKAEGIACTRVRVPTRCGGHAAAVSA